MWWSFFIEINWVKNANFSPIIRRKYFYSRSIRPRSCLG
jgi:hypothetical protein